MTAAVKLVTRRNWRVIQYTAPDGTYSAFTLGVFDRSYAMYVAKRVGELADAKRLGVEPSRRTMIWLGTTVGSPLHAWLVKAGLCLSERREQIRRLVELVDADRDALLRMNRRDRLACVAITNSRTLQAERGTP